MSHIAVSASIATIGSQIIEVAPYVAAPNGCSIWSTNSRAWYPVAAPRFRRRTRVRYRAESPPSIGGFDRCPARLRGRARHGDRRSCSNQAARSSAQCRGAAHARNLLKARRRKIRDRRCGNERPSAAGAVSGLDVGYWRWHRVRCQNTVPVARYDIVGPISVGDWLARERDLRSPRRFGCHCRSRRYGMAMASNYNSRPRAAEVMVDGEPAFSVRAPGNGH